MIVGGPDILRFAVVPVFLALALLDVRTRRIPRWVWHPILLAGGIALAWDTAVHYTTGGFRWELYAIRTAISVGVVAPLGYLFYRIRAFGRADAKAIIAIGLTFPTYPMLTVGGFRVPLAEAPLGVFSMTILTNAILVALCYPIGLFILNAVRGQFTPCMFVGRSVHWSSLDRRHGTLIEDGDGFTRSGLDLDALRMYCQWRSCSLGTIRANPESLREPPTAPGAEVGDGRVRTDGGDDPWGARAFLEAANGAYGTRPEELRDALELLTTREQVWFSPGIPFLLPLAIGLLIGLVIGDLFTILLQIPTT